MIAPVGVAVSSQNASPLLNQLLWNVVPKIDNCSGNYEDWRWEFDRMCDRLGQGKVLDERTKGMVLETALPENLLQKFDLLQRTPNLSFTGFMAKLNELFSKREAYDGGKKNWIELSCPRKERSAPKSSKILKFSFRMLSKISMIWARKRIGEFYSAKCQTG